MIVCIFYINGQSAGAERDWGLRPNISGEEFITHVLPGTVSWAKSEHHIQCSLGPLSTKQWSGNKITLSEVKGIPSK